MKEKKQKSGGKRLMESGLKPLQMAPLSAEELEIVRAAAARDGRSMRQFSRIATIERAERILASAATCG